MLDLDPIVALGAPDDDLALALAKTRFKGFGSAGRESHLAAPFVRAVGVFYAKPVVAGGPLGATPVGGVSDEYAFVAGVEEPEGGTLRVGEDRELGGGLRGAGRASVTQPVPDGADGHQNEQDEPKQVRGRSREATTRRRRSVGSRSGAGQGPFEGVEFSLTCFSEGRLV